MNTDAIYEAIFDGDCQKLCTLVDKIGADFQLANDKWNLLHMALISLMETPEPRVVQHLVDLGVDINGRDCYLNTPLHYASRNKNVEIMKILLDAGSEVDPVNQDMITPLRMTLSKPYNYDAIKLLLEKGANANHECKGCTIKTLAGTLSHGEQKDLITLFE